MKLLPLTAIVLSLTLARAEDAPTPTLRQTVDSLSDADLKEFITLLKERYIKPAALNDAEQARAMIQGLVERLAPGVALLPPPTPGTNEPSPFKEETIAGNIGYIRLGSLVPANLGHLDAALLDFAKKPVSAVILDLRATPAGSEFEQAAEVAKRFCPKGKVLFTVKKPSIQQEQILTSKDEPKYTGLLIALVDHDAAGASEVIAAVLRTHVNAMIIGQKTRGEAVEFADLPLPSGKLLRVAIAEVSLPDNTHVFPGGVKPDLAVDVTPEANAAVLKQGLESGVAGLIVDAERTKMNEAALVAGRNPELDALQIQQAKKAEKPKLPLRDVVLQRAVDFVTTLSIYGKKPAK